MSIIDGIKNKLHIIRSQLMDSYNQGAQLGKELKKSHKEKLFGGKKK